MALQVGSRLGHYDVTALIGEGGMGQVYQATDKKLNRQVALNILPEAFASDPDRLARFQREAQVLASLTSSTRRTERVSGCPAFDPWAAWVSMHAPESAPWGRHFCAATIPIASLGVECSRPSYLWL